MKLLARTSFYRGALLVAGLALSPWVSAQAPAIHYMSVTKDANYTQRSATDVGMYSAPTPCSFQCGYGFSAYFGGANLGSIATPILSGPVNTAGLPQWNGGALSFGGSEWRIGDGSWNQATSAGELDGRFGSGTYTFSANGANVALNLAAAAYPNKPVITLTGGRWNGQVYLVDPGRPFTMTTNAYTDFSAHRDGHIHIYVGRAGVNVADLWLTRSGGHPSNQGTITVAAHTLVEGQEYYAAAHFSAVVDENATAVANLNATAEYRSITNVRIVAQSDPTVPPVFPMTVTSNITPTVANATAQIQYRPQDVGTTGSVYVFAVAPATVVKPPLLKGADLGWKAQGAPKADPVACVLAQLGADGQLHAVSAANLQAYVTGALTAQGAAINVLNAVSTPAVAGVTMYVGYGANASAMINSGINRSVVAVPGPVECKPQPPQTGWWWNAAEGGRGYSIEAQGNSLFMASYFYDAGGRATWLVASGPTSLDGSLFTAPLFACSGGVTLAGAYRANTCTQSGTVTLAFNSAALGTMVWPGGTVAIERFNIVPGGLGAAPQVGAPESGWWWSAAENGRGFFIEWQNGSANIAGYMYDDAGNPIWYITVATTPAPLAFNGTWWQYANGMTMAGPYRAPTQVSANVGPTTIAFTSTTTATMTLPGGRQIALTRFRF